MRHLLLTNPVIPLIAGAIVMVIAAVAIIATGLVGWIAQLPATLLGVVS